MSTRSVNLNEQAARITLLTLGTNTKSPASPREFVIVPRRKPVELDEAVQILAQLEKPLECDSRIEGTRLIVECRTMSPTTREDYRLRAASRTARWDATVHRLSRGADAPVLLLRGSHGSLRVSYQAFRQWLSEYSLPSGFSHVGPRDPAPPGISVVLDVDPASDAVVHMIHREE
jgi:hypothetical protein